MAPHGRIQLDFAVQYDNPGFENSRPNTDIVHNGTFINDRYSPYIGYAPDIELTDDSTRHKHGLDKARRLPTLDDVAARQYNSGSFDADWINFEATVSTAPDQIAIAPGYLQKEWVENGRRYFHYKMDAPILNLYSIQSARYAVRRDRWHNVNLEIYYQPGHEFDLDTMMESMKETLAYCTANFSPFQFHQLRIIEFPGYGTFAESFANTIPFSESIGFITKISNKPDAVNLPFYVTAHETGHQWWAHQVMSAYVQGANLDRRDHGAIHRADGDEAPLRAGGDEAIPALRTRSVSVAAAAVERNEENPLYKVDPNQGYIHYRKGAMVMYALQDYIGEDKVNEAIREFLKTVSPSRAAVSDFARSGRLLPEGHAAAVSVPVRRPVPEHHDLRLTARFQPITCKQPDGKYQVHLTVEAKKVRADGRGQEQTVPVNDLIDIGVLDADGKYLYLEKQKIDQEKTDITITVDKLPAKAGIDPVDKLIDRNPDDNVIAVKKR